MNPPSAPTPPAGATAQNGELDTPPAAVAAPPPAPLFGPLPRRPQIAAKAKKASTLELPPQQVFQPPFVAVLRRLFIWSFHIGRFLIRIKIAGWRYRSDVRSEARMLREILEQMGPTAIKVGQQLSVRADLLPAEYCDELSKMLDRVPPVPFEVALPVIERAVKRPLAEVFERIDQVPIGSASLACVYQAKLHSGELVAIKVKRPGIGLQLFTDLKTISWLCEGAEMLGLIRGDLTRNFRLELQRMLTEELNFRLEARYTEIFRRTSKRHKYVSAPRVYADFCDNEVLVTEFVAGVFLNELLNAVEQEDPTDLHRLMARGYSPKKISRRMMSVFHWECFESLFFHADPHPANVIVRPDNTIVMIDFGSCGSVSNRVKRKLLAFNRLMAEQDLSGMVQNTIAMLEPLPHFDVDSFAIDLTNLYREIFIALKSKHSPWYDKCSGAMWMRVIALNRNYNIPMTLDTVRIFRASFMYDSIIYRLNAELDPVKEFKRWSDSANRRQRRNMEQTLAARLLGPLDNDFVRVAELNSVLESTMNRLSDTLDRPSYTFAHTIGKFAFFCTVSLKTAVTVVGLVLIIALIRFFSGAGTAPEGFGNQEFVEAIVWTVNNRFFMAGLAIYGLITIRKILFRIQDIDVN